MLSTPCLKPSNVPPGNSEEKLQIPTRGLREGFSRKVMSLKAQLNCIHNNARSMAARGAGNGGVLQKL